MRIVLNIKNAYARSHLSSDLLATSRGHTFSPTRGRAAACAYPSSTLLPRNKRANNVRFGFEKHNSHSTSSHHLTKLIPSDPPPHAAAGASPSPTLLPRNKRANNVRFGFEKHNSHSKSHHLTILIPSVPPLSVDCYVPPEASPIPRCGWRLSFSYVVAKEQKSKILDFVF